jgi:GrpB-like predicted nucleotidyltransferase (UPF0157 family)
MSPSRPSIPILVSEYDPAWPREFDREKTRLQSALGPTLLALEHIGSTAVPGMAAKRILDMMGGLRRLEDFLLCLEPLRRLGYEYVAEFNPDIPDRRFFRRLSRRQWTHHLHLFEADGASWRRHLRFRDLLRGDPALAKRYEDLKRSLAERFRSDRDAYTDAKSEFIRKALEQPGAP